MSYGFGTRVEAPYTDVLAQVRNALGENGFGVITEIDLAKTLHDKIGAEIPAQVILGACSPSHGNWPTPALQRCGARGWGGDNRRGD